MHTLPFVCALFLLVLKGTCLQWPTEKRKECIVHLSQAGLVYHKAWTMISLSMAIMFMRTYRRVALAWPSPFMRVSIFQKTCNHKSSCCYKKKQKMKKLQINLARLYKCTFPLMIGKILCLMETSRAEPGLCCTRSSSNPNRNPNS